MSRYNKPWRDAGPPAPTQADLEEEREKRRTFERDFADAAAIGATYRTTDGIDCRVTVAGLEVEHADAARLQWVEPHPAGPRIEAPWLVAWSRLSLAELARVAAGLRFVRHPDTIGHVAEVTWAQFVDACRRGDVADSKGRPIGAARVAAIVGTTVRRVSDDADDPPGQPQNRPYGAPGAAQGATSGRSTESRTTEAENAKKGHFRPPQGGF